MDTNAYIECLTRPKTVTAMRFLKYLCIMLLVAFILLGLLFGSIIAFIVVVAAGVGVWFFNLYSYVEYEYQYIDRELTVDRILNKSRRKTLASYQLDQLEIMAPISSYHLDDYKNRQLTTTDYSAGPDQPDPRYALILEGNKRLILEPSEGLVKAIKNTAPRKVFTD